ncbi:MAG: glycosyltransferase family 4 protein [Anaerolineae bacterium]|nr:glycosyltransferase family 4 protein [Anaerolineae bacterium]
MTDSSYKLSNSIKQSQKHLLWINTDPLETLGVGTWLYTTHELRQLGWQVTLIAPDSAGIHKKFDIEYLGIPMPKVYLIRQIIYHLRILSYLFRLPEKPQIILFHEMSVPVFFPVLLLRNLIGKQTPLFVLDIRSLPMQPKEISSWKDRLRRRYFYAINWLANHGAVDGRVVITQPMARVLKIPPQKLWGVWTSGVQLEKFAEASSKRNWGIARQQVRLMYIGSMSDGRNLTVFGRAVLAACRQNMNFTMTFIGEGTEMNDLLLLQKESEGIIQVIAHVPHQEIPDWLAKAHVGVLPFPDEIKFRVSSPIKLFEYMASGLAILATRIECHTSVIENADYVFWAKESSIDSFLETLHLVWENREQLAIMGKRASEAAYQWTWAESARALSQALEYGIRQYG